MRWVTPSRLMAPPSSKSARWANRRPKRGSRVTYEVVSAWRLCHPYPLVMELVDKVRELPDCEARVSDGLRDARRSAYIPWAWEFKSPQGGHLLCQRRRGKLR